MTGVQTCALPICNDNAKKNSVAETILTFLPQHMPSVTVDLLLANILAGPLQQLAIHFARYTRPGGELLLAGLLEELAADLMAYYRQWFAMDIDQQVEEWVCLHGTRLDTPTCET